MLTKVTSRRASRGARGVLIAFVFVLASAVGFAQPAQAVAGVDDVAFAGIIAASFGEGALTGVTTAAGAVCATGAGCVVVGVLAAAVLVGGVGYMAWQLSNQPNADMVNPVEGNYGQPGYAWVTTPSIFTNGTDNCAVAYSFTVDPSARLTSGSYNIYAYYSWTAANGTTTRAAQALTKGWNSISPDGSFTMTSSSFSPCAGSGRTGLKLDGLVVDNASNNTQSLTGCTTNYGALGCYWRVGDLAWGGTPVFTTPAATVPNPAGGYPADPQRKIQARGTCTAAGNFSASYAYAYSSIYHQSDATLPGIPIPACPPGTTLTRVEAWEYTLNNSGRWIIDTTPVFDVSYTAPAIDTYGTCLTGGADCAGPKIETNPTTGTQTCTWGPYVTSGANCVEIPWTNPDGTPYYTPAPTPTPTATGNPTPTPTPTPTATPTPTPTPTPTATTNPDPSPTPTSTTPTDPNTNDPQQVANPTTPTDGSGCAPSGWGLLNPFSYVRSTVCILEWAFVPPDMATPVTQIQTAYTGTALGTVVEAGNDFIGPLGGFSGATPEATDCRGPHIVLPLPMDQPDLSFYPFAACEPPGSTMSQLVLILSTITVAIGGIWAVAAIVLPSFGLSLPFFNKEGE